MAQPCPLGIGQLKDCLKFLQNLEAAGTVASSDTLDDVQTALSTLIDEQGA